MLKACISLAVLVQCPADVTGDAQACDSHRISDNSALACIQCDSQCAWPVQLIWYTDIDSLRQQVWQKYLRHSEELSAADS